MRCGGGGAGLLGWSLEGADKSQESVSEGYEGRYEEHNVSL